MLWHTDSPLVMSAVSFAALLPLLLVQLPAGVLVDRWDRRRLMVICEGARAVALGSVVDTLAAGRFSAVQLAAVAFQGAQEVLRTELAEGLRWLWRQRFLRTVLAFVAGSNLLPQVRRWHTSGSSRRRADRRAPSPSSWPWAESAASPGP
ncbi:MULTISPECIES: MFS transporter [unclassified Streptomyces]|uniref:MFS transporter n=1 Tax=unclassified Streptomyces TaxID=2593676 RepID=UPI00073BEE21|nr:MFS transporter [Streptomyces sp. AVP053U2]ODA71227.1 hypothetical protein APS67_004572 [Streptomyces sp. AVP053U2]